MSNFNPPAGGRMSNVREWNLLFTTTNPDKAREHERILRSLAPQLDIHLGAIKLDLTEIQTLDVVAIAEHKAIEAHKLTGRAVLIEDTSFALLQLKGFPGPFIKWYLDGCKTEGLCRLADQTTDRRALVTTVYSLSFDGKVALSFRGDTRGIVPPHPLGSKGFGWDPCFIPDGQKQGKKLSFGQMSGSEKDRYSMRRKALEKLLSRLTRRRTFPTVE